MMFGKKKNAASRMKHQLVLQQLNTSSDGIGGTTRAWSDVATLWAEITPISGSEKFNYNQQTSKQRFRIKLRYRSDITTSMRLYDSAGSRAFNIRSVINVEEQDHTTEVLADIVYPSV